MKPHYFLLICIGLLWSSSDLNGQRISLPENAESANEGYIVTLDNKRLTGKIGDVFYSDFFSAVVFINDFGTPYQLRAELISGFVFEDNASLIEYVSLFQPEFNNWSFLKVLEKGALVTLFKAPNGSTIRDLREVDTKISALSSDKYWLKFREKRPFEINWSNYKSMLKEQLIYYPEIRKKIGKKGYRFKDLDAIIEEVNNAYITRRRTI